MKSPELEKIEFAKTHKDLYSATSKIKEVDADLHDPTGSVVWYQR